MGVVHGVLHGAGTWCATWCWYNVNVIHDGDWYNVPLVRGVVHGMVHDVYWYMLVKLRKHPVAGGGNGFAHK